MPKSVKTFQPDLFQIYRRSRLLPPWPASTCVFGVLVVNCPGFLVKMR